jgi:hypothetical protein
MDAAPADDSCPLEILSASYGSQQREVEVTACLVHMIKAGRLTVTASNELAGDPHSGVQKTLSIRYRSYGKVYWVRVEEGQSISLPD